MDGLSLRRGLGEVERFTYRVPIYTTLEFTLEQPGSVEITILSQLGRVVDQLVQKGEKGVNRVSWHAGSLPAGVYVCRVTAGKMIAGCKMVKL